MLPIIANFVSNHCHLGINWNTKMKFYDFYLRTYLVKWLYNFERFKKNIMIKQNSTTSNEAYRGIFELFQNQPLI